MTDLGRTLRSEPLVPHPGAFIRDGYTQFGQQILYIAQARSTLKVRPNGMGNDRAGETEALQTEP